jgi:hypothetical protein
MVSDPAVHVPSEILALIVKGLLVAKRTFVLFNIVLVTKQLSVFRLLQERNALVPILVTLFGIVTLVKLVQEKNA